MQGPAELLPVSSSGHVALLPHLLGWDARSGPAPPGAALVTGLAAVPLARGRRWHGLAAYRIALGAATLWARGK